MAEPEDVILEGAHAATAYVAELWRRRAYGTPWLTLAEIRRRLEWLTAALYGEARPIIAAEPRARPSLAGRIAHRIPRHLLDDAAVPSTDGERIFLPRSLENSAASGGYDSYQLLAVEQAARAARGTPSQVQRQLSLEVQDFYELSEAAAVDHRLALDVPGLVPTLIKSRQRARALRPRLSLLTPRERQAETMLRLLLESYPAQLPPGIPLAIAPTDSLAWAIREATKLEPLHGRYRGLPPVILWGRATRPALRAPGIASESNSPERSVAPERTRTMRRRPSVRSEDEGEDDTSMGMSMIQLDDPQEHVEDPRGLQRPVDRDENADAGDLADSLSELPEAMLVTRPGLASEILVSENPPTPRPLSVPPSPGVSRTAYPEWDWRIAAYHPAHAVVRESIASARETNWTVSVLRKRAREIREVRRQFERLRSQRVRLGRQLDGEDVDISAYVTAQADTRAGRPTDDRLYQSVRRARRDIAISILVDISASTDSWLSDHRRIIDVEKEAVLLLCEALDSVGDRFSISAFSGEGPRGVAVLQVKAFDERYDESVRRRIAGLEHDRYTRLGAAIRHVTSSLMRESARHRLLLVLSDGKPNDIDEYEGRYGIEDTRQAVAEVRLQGAHPFCVTVDREAPAYIQRTFGPGAYSVLRRPDTLPQSLVQVVRRLLNS